MSAMLQALLAIPGLGGLLQGLFGLIGKGLIYWKGGHDAHQRDQLLAAQAELVRAAREQRDREDRARLELQIARDDPAVVRERLREYRARILRGQQRDV